MRALDTVTEFGRALDRDDFERVKTLLSPSCVYHIGKRELVGPDAITASYKNAMIAGREKLDELIWGACIVEPIDPATLHVHFTDYLTHRGQSYTHRCTQRVVVGDTLIVSIHNLNDPAETTRLQAFYASVGISS